MNVKLVFHLAKTKGRFYDPFSKDARWMLISLDDVSNDDNAEKKWMNIKQPPVCPPPRTPEGEY